MKVNLSTWEVDDEFRRILRRWWGKPGLATRKEVRDWAFGVLVGEAMAISPEVGDES